MPRPRRIQYEGAVYHVTSRGNERRKIVQDDSDRWLFVRLLAEATDRFNLLCHAWVLMDNHYHLLLETPAGNLSAAMKHLNAVYTQKYNRRHERVGHLFQGRFKAIHVEKEAYLKELCRYVVLNPVRAGMVKRPGDWKWSSYRATAGLEKPAPWLSVGWLWGQFGRNPAEARSAYRDFVSQGIRLKESPMGKATRLYLGGEDFRDKVRGFVGDLDHPDIPRYQKRGVPAPEGDLLRRVAVAYGTGVDDLLRPGKKGNEARDVAMYLLQREGGRTLRQIGEKFGVSYSAVGNRCGVVRDRVVKEPALARRVEKCKMKA
ncbi:MAG TPA: transposase [bacterium]|nr:transposase [bacterium]